MRAPTKKHHSCCVPCQPTIWTQVINLGSYCILTGVAGLDINTHHSVGLMGSWDVASGGRRQQLLHEVVQYSAVQKWSDLINLQLKGAILFLSTHLSYDQPAPQCLCRQTPFYSLSFKQMPRHCISQWACFKRYQGWLWQKEIINPFGEEMEEDDYPLV